MSLSLSRKSLKIIEDDSCKKLNRIVKSKETRINIKMEAGKAGQNIKIQKLLLLSASSTKDTTAKKVRLVIWKYSYSPLIFLAPEKYNKKQARN